MNNSKHILKYITSVRVGDRGNDQINVSLGFEKNGSIGMYLQDTAELDQDSTYINEIAFPNSGLLATGKYSLWISMFSRHIQTCMADDD